MQGTVLSNAFLLWTSLFSNRGLIDAVLLLVNSVVMPVSVFGTLCLLRADFVYSQQHNHNHNSIDSSPMESVEEFIY